MPYIFFSTVADLAPSDKEMKYSWEYRGTTLLIPVYRSANKVFCFWEPLFTRTNELFRVAIHIM